MAEKINFVNTDPAAVVAAIGAYYENITAKKLQPSQVETMVFNAAGYRIALMLNQLNETANQCLVSFATGAALDALAELLGVTRLPAAAAVTTIRFTFVTGHAALVMDAGLRVQSIDGQAIFTTLQTKSVAEVDTYVDILCECTKTGAIGNGYIAGKISIILDPRPYVATASNLTTTSAGVDDETDTELRERVLLAPSAFSVAGPKDAYKFWAKTAHPSIVDVAVTIGHALTTPFAIIPGQVDIFPLLLNNETPSVEILNAVYAICNDDKIRPLTDTVLVKSPTQVNYTMSVQLTILSDAISGTVQAAVTTALQAYRDARKNKLGIDVVRNQIIGVCQAVDGVYNVNVVNPASNLVVDESSFTNCTAITVTVTGSSDE